MSVGVVIPEPVHQFFNSTTGEPLANGFVHAYAAGTLNRQDTFSDAALTTPNTNPVQLNASGCAVIYCSYLSYKFDVQDSSGNSQSGYPRDNIIACAGQSLTVSLAASGGAALVGFLQSGTGAVARTVQSKLRDWVCPEDFGAVGNGVTDDHAAVQLALNDTRPTYLPGVYSCGTTGLTISGSNKSVYGGGILSQLKWSTSFTGTGILVSNTNVFLRDFWLSKPTQAGIPAATIIALQNTSNTGRYLNIVVSNPEATFTYSGWGVGCDVANFTHVFLGCRFSAARIGFQSIRSNQTDLVNCMCAAQITAGISFTGGGGNSLVGCDVEGNSTTGIYISQGASANSGEGTMNISGGYIEGQTDTQIDVVGDVAPGHNVYGVTISGVVFSGQSLTTRAVRASRTSGLLIMGCDMTSQVTNSIVIGGLNVDCVVLGNRLSTAMTVDATSTGVFQHTDGTGFNLIGQTIQSPFYCSAASSVLTIAANVIAPTNAVHHLGAGLVKTITVPAILTPTGSLTLVPDAAFTWDATGNISVAGTAVINRAVTFTWDGTKWNPSYV